MQKGETCTCRACTGEWPLTGRERTYLEDWVEKHPLTDEDRAAEPVAAVDADGMVYWKQASLDEQVMYLIAKWLWDEAVGE
jgi:hypothetical protein